MKDTSSTHTQNIPSIKANNRVPHKAAQLMPKGKQASQVINELHVERNRLLKTSVDVKFKASAR